MAGYTSIDSTFLNDAQEIFHNTYTQAPKTNIQDMTQPSPRDFMARNMAPSLSKYHKYSAQSKFDGFMNDYYDDEGWWALAWIRAYDLTKSARYLRAATEIFDDMVTGWDNSTCGGVWWDKNRTAINAIENELFLSLAAHLANRASSKEYYLRWAIKEWSWFQGTGMMGLRYNINDGIDLSTCKNNQGQVWSYNQGVILGALVELNKARPNPSYLDTAVKIANAAVTRLCDANGVLHDPCEPNCGFDGPQFKGVFMRNLQILQQAVPTAKFEQTITKNADSIWAHNRGIGNRFGLVWSGPYDNNPSASTQSSACEALIAAASLNSSVTHSLAERAPFVSSMPPMDLLGTHGK